MDTKQVGEKLVELCNAGKNMEAVETLYGQDIVSVEAMGNAEMPAESRGIDAIRGKHEWWYANNEVHSGSCEGPWPNPNTDRFAVRHKYEVTPKVGPMAGKRTTMDEIAVYTVKDGKIVREEFYYAT